MFSFASTLDVHIDVVNEVSDLQNGSYDGLRKIK